VSHPNTVAYSGGAVCCPNENSARTHDRAGWRATWIDPGGAHAIPERGSSVGPGVTLGNARNYYVALPHRWWTR
jgi:hypothetical protein